ncbi:hypothetical protein PHMEG_00012138 [Phytophthora megakarya]|uniref:Uncharacterized protein n=1 Tax=Phytophthora megakarya TaxID=4795 RepID=A0A225W9Y9_9STRA|nr:hypothetical protein PHMEG_00012138 [Phytophthora megakarya]
MKRPQPQVEVDESAHATLDHSHAARLARHAHTLTKSENTRNGVTERDFMKQHVIRLMQSRIYTVISRAEVPIRILILETVL